MTTRPLRVLVVHPSGDLYGSDCMVVEAVIGMLEDGGQVLVVLAEPGPLLARLQAAGATVSVVETLVIRKALLSPVAALAGIGRTLKSLLPLLGVVLRFRPHVMYVSTLTIPLWVLVARVLRVPVLLHVHEAEAAAHPWVRKALHAPLRCAHRILTNSAFAGATLCADAPRYASRIRTLSNGVKTAAQPTPMSTSGPLRLGYLGRWSPRKGLHVALAVHRELRRRGLSTELHIAGGAFAGYEWYAEELRRVEAEGVTWQGRVHDPAAFLTGVDVALVPSILAEPYGNVAVEALGAARPVVVSRCGGLPEAVQGSSAAVQVRAGHVQAWADAIAAIAADRPHFAAMALRDAPRIAQRHGLEPYRRTLCAELRQLAHSRGGHR